MRNFMPIETRTIVIKYFAWIRERIGKSEEVLEPPAAVTTAAQLMRWLSARGEEYAYAFESPATIRVAINHAHVRADAPIPGACEIAFFPPMTGG
jgi:molybdopterin synthase sulfur carrier subunit